MAFDQKIDYIAQVEEILNLKGNQNLFTVSKVTAILPDLLDFAYRWSWIGKGLRLQPAQQACLTRFSFNMFSAVLGAETSLLYYIEF